MTLDFYLRYKTQYGQQIFILSDNLPGEKGEISERRILMQYHDEDYWHVRLELPDDFDEYIGYYYAVRYRDGLEIFDGEENRFIDLTGKKKQKRITIIDTWNYAGNIHNAFFTKAFQKVLLPGISHKTHRLPKQFTHEFRVKAPMLKEHETICLCGSTKNLNNWDSANPILMTAENSWFYTRIRMEDNEWPASYKYGIYNMAEKSLVAFEEGENRMLRSWELNEGITILQDGFVRYQRPLWRGSGVYIPVFSLRSNKSFGVGEFTDLKLLVDWAQQTGIELIQLLPVNDTSAHHDWRDSYPYSAISSFALHPLYINLEKVAGKSGAHLIKALRKKQKQLNSLPQVDYEQVMKFKRSALRELYDLEKDALKDNIDYFNFFELNRHWLVPYAAFCYLKTKYKTADFKKWKRHSNYDEAAIQKLVSPTQKHYNDIAFYYFTQYHLHKQLKDISLYAHRNKITLKGDIPIGIYRYSCDAWVNPDLYNMNEQSGAPPDEFASKGQNWGFPTYDWEEMKKDDFKWWRTRFDQLSNYFDVFRIDHILGFFRIWSIPIDAVEGVMGRFIPALPVYRSEFDQNRIYFDRKRYCEPFIIQDVLEKIFGKEVEKVKELFLNDNKDGTFSLKEFVNTQRGALDYLLQNNLTQYKEGLFQLIANIILFERKDTGGQEFDFRIAIDSTTSFQYLDEYTRSQLLWLYNNYFFERQDYFWKKKAMQKLPQLKRSTRMLVCGEDLGMVPPCVPEVMKELGILSLEVERMPKSHAIEFFHPNDANYLSIVTPSTHDMSTIREWWTEDRAKTQRFYNYMLGHYGEAPQNCEPWIVKDIFVQHLYSPAMWCIFLMQDILAMKEDLRVEDPKDERINVPSDPNHYWRYRMPVTLEQLVKEKEFNASLRELISQSGRLQQNL